MNPLSPLQTINHPLFNEKKLTVSIKRDDLIHPIISGNKWRKLKQNLQHAKQQNYRGILSFGGAFSNHIHALAYACQQQELQCLAVIRGEPHYQTNYTLSWAKHWGMQLTFVDRQTYRQRQSDDYLKRLQQQYPDYLIVPEGGSNHLALAGAGEIITELKQQIDYQHLILPVGSGGTIAGIIQADNNQHNILGIAVLKQANYLNQEIQQLLGKQSITKNWQLLEQFHDGGYGKFSAQSVQTIQSFYQQTKIPFEPIYSGKMLVALLKLAEQNYFSPGEHIVMLHTGGLQGLGGLAERGLIATKDWPQLPSKPR